MFTMLVLCLQLVVCQQLKVVQVGLPQSQYLDQGLVSKNFNYAGFMPIISGVSPSRGGTGGGTTITVSGSGFG